MTKTAKPESEYISRREAAELLDVDVRTVDHNIKRGMLKTFKPAVIRGRGSVRVLLKRQDVEALATAPPFAPRAYRPRGKRGEMIEQLKKMKPGEWCSFYVHGDRKDTYEWQRVAIYAAHFLGIKIETKTRPNSARNKYKVYIHRVSETPHAAPSNQDAGTAAMSGEVSE